MAEFCEVLLGGACVYVLAPHALPALLRVEQAGHAAVEAGHLVLRRDRRKPFGLPRWQPIARACPAPLAPFGGLEFGLARGGVEGPRAPTAAAKGG